MSRNALSFSMVDNIRIPGYLVAPKCVTVTAVVLYTTGSLTYAPIASENILISRNFGMATWKVLTVN